MSNHHLKESKNIRKYIGSPFWGALLIGIQTSRSAWSPFCMEQVKMQTAPTVGNAKVGPYQGSSVWRGGNSFYAQHEVPIKKTA
jgi:hypothetical protein